MTQEEKAKRYDELLLKLQKAKVDDNVCDDRYCIVIDGIVPELEEIEDEKIRKAIHIYLDWLDGRKDYAPKGEYSIRDMIAWLKKQGEQNPVPAWMPIFLDELRAKRRCFDWDESKDIDGKILAIIRWMNPNYFNGKDGEQKLVPKFEVGDIMRTLKEVADGMTDGMPVVVSIDEEYYHCNNELIAIKDQDNYEYPPMNKRQKPAWSEDDKVILDDIIDFFENGTVKLQHDLSLYASWLRSLKQRYTWKPSDKQMQCLHDAINHYHTNGYPASKLNELYEQMSKIYKL